MRSYKNKISNVITSAWALQVPQRQLIPFVAKYCVNIEAYISYDPIPLDPLAHFLGAKLKFVIGRLLHDWRDYEILKKFSKLEGTLGNVCPVVLIENNLPLKYIEVPCAPLLFISCRCASEFFTLQPSGHHPLPSVKFLQVDFAFSNLEIHCKFTFPNLRQIRIHSLVRKIQPIATWLVDSPNLEVMLFTHKAHMCFIAWDLMRLLEKLPNLKSLGHIYVRPSGEPSACSILQPPLELLQVLASSCPLLRELNIPLQSISPEGAQILAQMPSLSSIKLIDAPDESFLVFLTNWKLLAPKQFLIQHQGDNREFEHPDLLRLIKELHESNHLRLVKVPYGSLSSRIGTICVFK